MLFRFVRSVMANLDGPPCNCFLTRQTSKGIFLPRSHFITRHETGRVLVFLAAVLWDLPCPTSCISRHARVRDKMMLMSQWSKYPNQQNAPSSTCILVRLIGRDAGNMYVNMHRGVWIPPATYYYPKYITGSPYLGREA